MKSVRTTLLLTTCLLLAMPVGWCCLFALSTPSTAPAAKVTRDCCNSCCPQQSPQDEEAPTRAPMLLCCCENNVSLPEGSVKVEPIAAVAILSIPVVVCPLAIPLDRRSATELNLSPPRALNVLQCLWLC